MAVVRLGALCDAAGTSRVSAITLTFTDAVADQ